MKRSLLLLLAIGVVVGGLAAVADALVVTERERLEQLVDSLEGEVQDTTLDELLHFVETDREPIEVRSSDGTQVFESADAELARRTREALRPLRGSEIEIIQRTIELEDDEAHIALRARTRHGVVDANVDLAKHGERWLIWRARVR
jgi:hypothetical protein